MLKIIQSKLTFFSFMLERDIFWIYPATFLSAFIGFCLLFYIQRAKTTGFLKRLFHISARKSATNAVQLGGLPLSLSIIAGVIFLFNHDSFSSFFGRFDFYSIKYWLISASIVVTYGYLDDRFELRPIVKLVLQISSICLFAMLESRVLFPKWSALAFVVISFWGLGVLNGSNLLDGLDTLTIKLGSVTFLSYLVIAWNFSIGSVALGSCVVLCSLAAFYFFNKEPAKIHLGEIGGSFIGFSSLLVSCFVYSYLSRTKIDSANALAMAIMPLSLPMVELGVSFLRRLYNRKSPFKGDKYHLHHLLRNYYGFSPSGASSIFAGGYAVIMMISFSLTHFFGPIFGTSCCVFLMTATYIAVGKSHWAGSNTLDLKPASLFDYLLKKDVGVINSLEVDGFELEIIGSLDGPLSEDLSQESVFGEEDGEDPNEEQDLVSKKKAA